MNADKFIASLGVLSVDLTPEVKTLLLEQIKDFFRTGGAVSWEDYMNMDESVRPLFKEAQMTVRAEELVLILKALAKEEAAT